MKAAKFKRQNLGKTRHKSKYEPHQGKRECARRIVQGHAGIKAMVGMVRKQCLGVIAENAKVSTYTKGKA